MAEKKSLTLKELKFVKLWDCLAYSFRKNMMKRKRPLPKMSLMVLCHSWDLPLKT